MIVLSKKISDSRSQCQEWSQALLGFVVPRDPTVHTEQRRGAGGGVQHCDPPPASGNRLAADEVTTTKNLVCSSLVFQHGGSVSSFLLKEQRVQPKHIRIM